MKFNKLFSYSAILMLSLLASAGCSKNKEKIIIRVLNSADYIYEAEENEFYCDNCGDYVDDVISEDGLTGSCPECGEEVYLDLDMMDQFVNYMNDKYSEEGLEFDYIYDTFDTPETAFNEMMTGKSSYDIVNVSDYMIQKMATAKLIQPLFANDQHSNEIRNNLERNITPLLWGTPNSTFNKTFPKKQKYSNGEDPYDRTMPISEFSVPYMWGTIGILYNPSYYLSRYIDANKEQIIEKFSSWDVLYSDFLTKTFSIKDSVRDVYAVAILHVYKDEIAKLDEDCKSQDEFNEKFTEIFNRCDKNTIDRIKDDIITLKRNAFGFEVDSGKTDMVDGKIGANIAWSGDATWAMIEAQTEQNKELYFVTPEEGSNIFTDAWCIPTVSKHRDYALDFIDFMSESEQAMSNMDSVCYTTATATEATLEYFKDICCVKDGYAGMYDTYDISYFFGDHVTDKNETNLHIYPKGYEETIEFWGYDVPAGLSRRVVESMFPKDSSRYRLAVMDDYGLHNPMVLDMWETVRTNPLPLWAFIILLIEIFTIIILSILFFVQKGIKKQLKKLRKQNR